jgi:hypothetical protein
MVTGVVAVLVVAVLGVAEVVPEDATGADDDAGAHAAATPRRVSRKGIRRRNMRASLPVDVVSSMRAA